LNSKGKLLSKFLIFKICFVSFNFFSETKDSNGNFICYVQLPDGPEVQGYGKNKKLAKHDACKKAMKNF